MSMKKQRQLKSSKIECQGLSPRWRLFVYGTLKAGQCNHGVLGGTTALNLGPAVFVPNLTLRVFTDSLVPFVVPKTGNRPGVWGQVVTVSDNAMWAIRKLEKGYIETVITINKLPTSIFIMYPIPEIDSFEMPQGVYTHRLAKLAQNNSLQDSLAEV